MVEQVLADGRDCLLDLSAVEFIDSTGIGWLIRLQKKIRVSGRQLVLLAPSHNVQRALKLMHLHNFFAAATDIPAALKLIAQHAREENAPATPRTAAAMNPLVWQGEITAANAELVWRRTEAHVRTLSAARRDVVIDLAAVRFIDSTGAGLMVRARKLACAGAQWAVEMEIRLSREKPGPGRPGKGTALALWKYLIEAARVMPKKHKVMKT